MVSLVRSLITKSIGNIEKRMMDLLWESSKFFALAALIHMILAYNIVVGLPPFYRSPRKLAKITLNHSPLEPNDVSDDDFAIIMPSIFGASIAFMLSALLELPIAFLISGLFLAYGGVRSRQYLRKTTTGPLPWIIHAPAPWFLKTWAFRWPMLLFDAWTLILSLALASLIML